MNDFKGAWEGLAARAAYTGLRSDAARAEYVRKAAQLKAGDDARRAQFKEQARWKTPPEILAGIEAKRKGLGRKRDSGGTAYRTNPGATRLARGPGAAGKAAGAASVVLAAHEIATSKDKPRAGRRYRRAAWRVWRPCGWRGIIDAARANSPYMDWQNTTGY